MILPWTLESLSRGYNIDTIVMPNFGSYRAALALSLPCSQTPDRVVNRIDLIDSQLAG